MDTKVKVENLKIGDRIYGIKSQYSTLRVDTHVVTGISLNRLGKLRAYLDYSNFPLFFNKSSYFSYSKAKAEKVLEKLKEQRKAREKRYQRRALIEQANQSHIKDIEEKLLGKVVMVYVGKGIWTKATINEVWASDKKGDYRFTTSPRGSGAYLLKREGKNWYFWSELDELEKKREELDKKIQSLKEKQGKKDA